jgi:dienelactone hydrolase
LPAAGDHWSRYAQTVEQIVDDASRQHGCDANRMYLTGFSFGGNGVFDLALAQPERWAALWPVDPTRVPSQPISIPIWLSLGQVSRYQAQAFIQQLALQPAGSDAHDDRVWVDEKVDHVQTATLAYRNARIYEWLLSKRR